MPKKGLARSGIPERPEPHHLKRAEVRLQLGPAHLFKDLQGRALRRENEEASIPRGQHPYLTLEFAREGLLRLDPAPMGELSPFGIEADQLAHPIAGPELSLLIAHEVARTLQQLRIEEGLALEG